MESVNKEEGTRIQACCEFITKGIEISIITLGFSESEVFIALLSLVCTTMKNYLKMTDQEAIAYFADAYVTYPEDGKIPVPLRKM